MRYGVESILAQRLVCNQYSVENVCPACGQVARAQG